MQTIGWEHAESVLRSLACAMLNHSGEQNPAQNDLEPDRAWKKNLELAAKFREGWESGLPTHAATDELVKILRTGSAEDAAIRVTEMINRNVSPQTIYDAMHPAAGERL